MKKIKVLHKKLLVRRIHADQTSTIILPDSMDKGSIGMGVVVQGSPDLTEGSRIYFSKYAGTDVELDDKPNEYLILDSRDVMAKEEDNEKTKTVSKTQ
jgi:co-chaperonin GroES (HSP10)